MRCPSWWKTFWFMVVVVMFVTIPQIGIDRREGRISFAILSVPLVAIIVTIVYVIKIVRPIRAVNAQLKKACRVFHAAVTLGSSWDRKEQPKSKSKGRQKPAGPLGASSGGSEGKAKFMRRKRRKKKISGNMASSVNISFSDFTGAVEREPTTDGGEATAAPPRFSSSILRRRADGATAGEGEGDGSEAAVCLENEGNDYEDTDMCSSVSSAVSHTDGKETQDEDGGKTETSAYSDAEEPETPASATSSSSKIELASRKAWDAMATTSKPSSGLPELYDLQKRSVELFDLYFALLLAHEVKLKCRDLNKASLLSANELSVFKELKIDLEDKVAQQLAAMRDEGAAPPNSSTLNVPSSLRQSGLLSPRVEIPFFLRRGNRFLGDNGMVAFYVSRSSDSYVVGYSVTTEGFAAGAEGGTVPVVGNAAIKALKDSAIAPPLTFDRGRGVEPLRGDWFVTTGGMAHGRGQSSGTSSSVVSLPSAVRDTSSRPGIQPTPLNFLERRFGYGVTLVPLTVCPVSADERVQGVTEGPAAALGGVRHCSRVSACFQALNGKTYTLAMARCHLADNFAGDGCAEHEGVWAPVLIGHVNSVLCVLESAHVTSSTPKHFWQMPTTQAIEIKGLSLENRGGLVSVGAWVTERIDYTS